MVDVLIPDEEGQYTQISESAAKQAGFVMTGKTSQGLKIYTKTGSQPTTPIKEPEHRITAPIVELRFSGKGVRYERVKIGERKIPITQEETITKIIDLPKDDPLRKALEKQLKGKEEYEKAVEGIKKTKDQPPIATAPKVIETKEGVKMVERPLTEEEAQSVSELEANKRLIIESPPGTKFETDTGELLSKEQAINFIDKQFERFRLARLQLASEELLTSTAPTVHEFSPLSKIVGTIWAGLEEVVAIPVGAGRERLAEKYGYEPPPPQRIKLGIPVGAGRERVAEKFGVTLPEPSIITIPEPFFSPFDPTVELPIAERVILGGLQVATTLVAGALIGKGVGALAKKLMPTKIGVESVLFVEPDETMTKISALRTKTPLGREITEGFVTIAQQPVRFGETVFSKAVTMGVEGAPTFEVAVAGMPRALPQLLEVPIIEKGIPVASKLIELPTGLAGEITPTIGVAITQDLTETGLKAVVRKLGERLKGAPSPLLETSETIVSREFGNILIKPRIPMSGLRVEQAGAMVGEVVRRGPIFGGEFTFRTSKGLRGVISESGLIIKTKEIGEKTVITREITEEALKAFPLVPTEVAERIITETALVTSKEVQSIVTPIIQTGAVPTGIAKTDELIEPTVKRPLVKEADKPSIELTKLTPKLSTEEMPREVSKDLRANITPPRRREVRKVTDSTITKEEERVKQRVISVTEPSVISRERFKPVVTIMPRKAELIKPAQIFLQQQEQLLQQKQLQQQLTDLGIAPPTPIPPIHIIKTIPPVPVLFSRKIITERKVKVRREIKRTISEEPSFTAVALDIRGAKPSDIFQRTFGIRPIPTKKEKKKKERRVPSVLRSTLSF